MNYQWQRETDDGVDIIDVEVDGPVTPGSPATWDDPGWPDECEDITTVWPVEFVARYAVDPETGAVAEVEPPTMTDKLRAELAAEFRDRIDECDWIDAEIRRKIVRDRLYA